MTAQPQVGADQVGRMSQIIVGALMMGVVMFGVVVLVVVNPGAAGGAKPPQQPILTWMAAGMAAVMLGTRAVVPGVIASVATKQALASGGDLRESLAPVYQTKTIIGNAMLEGAAFFGLVSYLIEHNWISLCAAGAMLVVMAATFPSQGQFEQWVDQTRRSQE